MNIFIRKSSMTKMQKHLLLRQFLNYKKTKTGEKQNKTDVAKLVGLEIAKKGVAKKIKKVTFDRAGYKYHGRVKALAAGAREGGLNF